MKFRTDKRGKAMVVGIAALAATAFAAPAATAAPAAAATSFCGTGIVQANVNAALYSGWESTRVIGKAVKFHNYGCNGWRQGRHYDACGGGNAWLLVHGDALTGSENVWGYAAATCFSDQ